MKKRGLDDGGGREREKDVSALVRTESHTQTLIPPPW